MSSLRNCDTSVASLLKHEPTIQLRNKPDTHIVENAALRFLLWEFFLIIKKINWKNGLSHMVTKEINIQVH